MFQSYSVNGPQYHSINTGHHSVKGYSVHIILCSIALKVRENKGGLDTSIHPHSTKVRPSERNHKGKAWYTHPQRLGQETREITKGKLDTHTLLPQRLGRENREMTSSPPSSSTKMTSTISYTEQLLNLRSRSFHGTTDCTAVVLWGTPYSTQ